MEYKAALKENTQIEVPQIFTFHYLRKCTLLHSATALAQSVCIVFCFCHGNCQVNSWQLRKIIFLLFASSNIIFFIALHYVLLRSHTCMLSFDLFLFVSLSVGLLLDVSIYLKSAIQIKLLLLFIISVPLD